LTRNEFYGKEITGKTQMDSLIRKNNTGFDGRRKTMKLYILTLIAAIAVLAGCSETFTRRADGVERYHSRSTNYVVGSETVIETNDQVYPVARAKYGQMPGNLQDGFAVEEAVAVHQRTMDNTLYPNGVGMGYNGWAGGVPAGYGYRPYVLSPRPMYMLNRDQYGNTRLVPAPVYYNPQTGYPLAPSY
jgi:hypothetical protein